MAVETRCPHCGMTYRVADQQAGQKVRCKKCHQAFTVPPAPKRPVGQPAAGKPSARDIPIVEPIDVEALQPGTPPLRPAARPVRVEHVKRPQGRASKKPAREAKSRRLLLPLLIGGAVAALVVLVAAGGLAVWLFLPRNPPLIGSETPVADEAPAQNLDELKAATVFVKVTAGPLHATGSGFVMKVEGNTGYIVTNDHVVNPDLAALRGLVRRGLALTRSAPEVTLVFWSGTKQEQSFRAEVVAADPERDLAVLKVAGVADLPKPIDISARIKLVETLPVTVFGFPFGEALALHEGNPSITVSKGSVSGIERDKQEQVAAVRIDGALNPGNSGGPVVDAEGRLVGVAVATIRGAHIGLAIPAGELAKMLDGRVGEISVTAKSVNAANAEVEVDVRLIDPLKRIQSVTVHYLRADLVKDNPLADKDGNWPELPGTQRVQLRLDRQRAMGTFLVLAADKDKAFTLQASYVDGAGRRIYAQPRSLPLSPQGPALAMRPPPADFNRPRVPAPRQNPPLVVPAPQLPPFLTQPPQPQKPPAAAKPSKPLAPITYRPFVPKAAKEEVALPGSVADVAVGGGGRYLILPLAGQKKLAVFDVQQGKIAKYLPVAEEVMHFAAGATRLVVVYPNAKILQIWNLTTFEKERSAALPGSLTGDEIHQVCMGSASPGPLFVYLPHEKRTLALDLTSLETTEVRWNHWGPGNAYGPLHMRASPDGTMLLGWAGGWAGLAMAIFDGGLQVGTYDKFEFSLGAFALPSSDGRLIFTPWAIVARDLTAAKVPELQHKAYLVPAHEPGYFLALRGSGALPNSPYGPEGAVNLPGVSAVDFYTDDRKRLFTLSDCDELKAGSNLYWERRVHYYPRAGLLLTLAKLAGNDRLVLRRIDLVEQLEKSGVDYLLVTSGPPPAKAGKLFSYRLGIRSKRGGVKVKLESGPSGLKASSDGLITWAIPAGFGESEADVLLTISDASGQELFHNFKIVLAGP